MGLLSSLFGGDQAKAAKKAAKIQSDASKRVEDLAGTTTTAGLGDLDTALSGALSQYDTAGTQVQPYADAGTSALDQLKAALGLSGDSARDQFVNNFRTSPGYQFQMDQGVKALDSSAAAKGGLYSGAQGKALTTFGQGLADQDYSSFLDRLTGLVSGGQNAASNLATLIGSKASAILGTGGDKANVRLGGLGAISNAINQGASANAGGVIGAANAKAAGVSNLLNLIGGVGKFALGGGLSGLGGLIGGSGGAGLALNAAGYKGLT